MEIDVRWSALLKAIHPVTTIVQQNVGNVYALLSQNDVGLAKAIAQSVIDSLDYTLEEVDSSNSPESLFKHPQIQHELEAQLAMN